MLPKRTPSCIPPSAVRWKAGTDSPRSSIRSSCESRREKLHSRHYNSRSHSRDARLSSRHSSTQSLNPKYIAPDHLPKRLKPVKTRLDDFLNFQSYRLINRDQRFNEYVASRIAKTAEFMQVQMSQNTFDPAGPIFVLIFLSSYRRSKRLATLMQCWKELPYVSSTFLFAATHRR